MNGHDFYDPDADFTTEEITRCNELAMRVIFDGWRVCKRCGGFGDDVTLWCRAAYFPQINPWWDLDIREDEIAKLPVYQAYQRWLEGGWDEPWAACPKCGSSVGCVQEDGQDPYYFCRSRSCVWGDFYTP